MGANARGIDRSGIRAEPSRIRGAWLGRVSGCQLGKAVERFSQAGGPDVLREYLRRVDALPLRDYVPFEEGTEPSLVQACCRGRLTRAEADDDINYSVLALMMLEAYGADLTTADVGRSWLKLMPGGATWTAERAAYSILLERSSVDYLLGSDDPGFDLELCAANPYSDWIGAQIRADMYGWVLPGRPERASDLARRDAQLSHQGEGVNGAVFVAALGAAIPASASLEDAVETALVSIPEGSAAAGAVRFARSLVGQQNATDLLHDRYRHLPPIHTVNNLAIVVWALLTGSDDFSVAVGEAVAAGWDTDCNGATVGGLWGLTGRPIPSHWTEPWSGRILVALAGVAELSSEELVDRTLAVAERFLTEGIESGARRADVGMKGAP